jgi:hypothetical protein
MHNSVTTILAIAPKKMLWLVQQRPAVKLRLLIAIRASSNALSLSA